MKVKKVGVLDLNNVLIVGPDAGTFAFLITGYRESEDSETIDLPLVIGDGPSAKEIKIEVPIRRSMLGSQLDRPTPLVLHPLMNNQLSSNKQREGDQETGMSVNVLNERNRHIMSPRVAVKGGENQERQPRNRNEENYASTQQLQRAAGKIGSAEKLVERTTQHERKVVTSFRANCADVHH